MALYELASAGGFHSKRPPAADFPACSVRCSVVPSGAPRAAPAEGRRLMLGRPGIRAPTSPTVGARFLISAAAVRGPRHDAGAGPRARAGGRPGGGPRCDFVAALVPSYSRPDAWRIEANPVARAASAVESQSDATSKQAPGPLTARPA